LRWSARTWRAATTCCTTGTHWFTHACRRYLGVIKARTAWNVWHREIKHDDTAPKPSSASNGVLTFLFGLTVRTICSFLED
jgi:hypothetical protein